MKIMNLNGTVENFNGETKSWVCGEVEFYLAYEGNELIGIEFDGIEENVLNDIVENIYSYDFPSTLEEYNGDDFYIGLNWGQLTEEDQNKLLKIANVYDDIKEGECIVDFGETLSICGIVVNTDEEKMLNINDDAEFYNPMDR